MNAPICLALSAAVFLGIGCKASVSADTNVGGEDSDLNEPLDGTAGTDQTAFTDSQQPGPLLGARQDLRYRGPAVVRCQCVDVAIGQAEDPSFEWSTTRPKTDPRSQLVIAIADASGACPGAPKESLGASYWGFETRGNDVIVVLEPAIEGVPVTAGAVIPKPLGDGLVYLKPVNTRYPYGKSLEKGLERCKIGNPGPPAVVEPGTPLKSVSGNVRIGVPKEQDDDPDSNMMSE